MTTKIDSKIVGYKVLSEEDDQDDSVPLEVVHEDMERPELLRGTTYRIKPPTYNISLYITINDMCLNEGTDNEVYVPFELFVVGKQMESFQWITAVSLLVSAVFKKGGNVTFLVKQLKSVFDPKGGYFLKGKYYNSVVHHIGTVVEQHFKELGLIADSKKKNKHTETYIEEPKADLPAVETQIDNQEEPTCEGKAREVLLKNAGICKECGERTYIKEGGCGKCVSENGCSFSECG